MKIFLFKMLFILIPIAGCGIGYFLFNDYHADLWYPIFTFCIGLSFTLIFMVVADWYHNIMIGTYKRKLEKESVTSTENFSRVKVLESKIEVLEKALENALKK